MEAYHLPAEGSPTRPAINPGYRLSRELLERLGEGRALRARGGLYR